MKHWLLHVRASGRLAFILRAAIMLPSIVLSLIWARALLHAMGPNNYGLFMAFQGVLSLAALGDFGMGGALQIRTSFLLANKRPDELHRLHATARLLFISIAAIGLPLILICSPWLPALFHFVETPASGSLTGLFIAGGFYALFVFLTAYYQTTLYAVGTVSWPVLPPFVVFHVGSALQLLLVWWHAPLWVQMVPSIVLAAACLFLYGQMVRASHPDLVGPLPLKLDTECTRVLLRSSFWYYLFSIAYCIYTTTDRLVVNAGFGASEVTPYLINYKLCDMAIMLIITIGFVTLPATVLRILAPEEEERRRGFAMAEKLRKIQTFLACVAAVFYLAVNDVFVRWWFGVESSVSFELQLAFAITVALMGASETAIQLWVRLGENFLRNAALVALASAVINLGLSYAAMTVGWLAGIAWATCIARAFFTFWAICTVASKFGVSRLRWMWNVFITPVFGLLLSYALFCWITPRTPSEWWLLVAADSFLLVLIFFACGLRPSLLREEYLMVRRILKPGET